MRRAAAFTLAAALTCAPARAQISSVCGHCGLDPGAARVRSDCLMLPDCSDGISPEDVAQARELVRKCGESLVARQSPDGSWPAGGKGSVAATALAVQALASLDPQPPAAEKAAEKGLRWLENEPAAATPEGRSAIALAAAASRRSTNYDDAPNVLRERLFRGAPADTRARAAILLFALWRSGGDQEARASLAAALEKGRPAREKDAGPWSADRPSPLGAEALARAVLLAEKREGGAAAKKAFDALVEELADIEPAPPPRITPPERRKRDPARLLWAAASLTLLRANVVEPARDCWPVSRMIIARVRSFGEPGAEDESRFGGAAWQTAARLLTAVHVLPALEEGLRDGKPRGPAARP